MGRVVGNAVGNTIVICDGIAVGNVVGNAVGTTIGNAIGYAVGWVVGRGGKLIMSLTEANNHQHTNHADHDHENSGGSDESTQLKRREMQVRISILWRDNKNGVVT